ncbi:MAG: ribokinase, partial [Microbacteriaceae bacterium]
MDTSNQAGVTMVGSANMDLVFSVERIPRPGETLLATSVARYPGGKGLNQAVAAARSGASTTFVGALGADDTGRELAATLQECGIDGALVRSSTEPTGQAFIVVDQQAENTIIVASGANATLTELTSAELAAIASSKVLLMQLELPMTLIEQAAAAARAARVMVILNAAPAQPLSDELLADTDCLIVNEHEACLIGGSEDLATASTDLAARVGQLIVTLGGAGAALYSGGAEVGRLTPPPVTVVDTTGAGDTFCGAFAAATAEGRALESAARFAVAAAALSVQ